MPKKTSRPRTEVRESDAPYQVAQANDMGMNDGSLMSASMASEPSDEDVRMRAYQKFLERGGVHGRDIEDWVDAKAELGGK
jgi:hypothetical protein